MSSPYEAAIRHVDRSVPLGVELGIGLRSHLPVGEEPCSEPSVVNAESLLT